MKIVESTDWLTYKSAWQECMKEFYWYQNNPVFDWNKDEELEEMETDFGKEGCVFLEARENSDIAGVFGFRYRGQEGSLRRWEPAAINCSERKKIHEQLLKYALDHLAEKGVKRTKVIIKHPFDSPETTQHLLELYEKFGFERYQPDGVDLIAKLDEVPNSPKVQDNITIDTEQGAIPENIGEYCVRAYASTPEDLEIHGYDNSVTSYDTAVLVLRNILSGGLGRSPEEFWKVALVDGEAAGFIGGFIRESKHWPTTGVFGPVGVFPEYRRLGLGLFLVSELFQAMKNHGCEYAAVGTPSANTNAIRMYKKAGFKMNCHLIHLEKQL